ncbi:MAG: hypothetical protein K8G79_02595 [bacterium]|uniref:Uncharacterized protein n=1 Tax=Candidatus Methylomirabilis tolerans TaxID=3123416 RepID=A0AAJ1EJU4_9BACT|nr:hypothetical protein [Candidatus Methylomirabilis sp.]
MMSDESTADKAGLQQEDRKEDAGKPLNPFQRNLEALISHIDSLNDHSTQAMVVISQSHKQANPLVQEFLKTEPSPVESEEDAFTIPEDKLTKFRRLQRKLDHGSRLPVGSGRPWSVERRRRSTGCR